MTDPDEISSNVVFNNILQELALLIKKPRMDSDIPQILRRYMILWENFDECLSNGIVHKNFNFNEAAVILQYCAALYCKKVDMLSDQVWSLREHLAKLSNNHPPETNSSESASTAETSRPIESAERNERAERRERIARNESHNISELAATASSSEPSEAQNSSVPTEAQNSSEPTQAQSSEPTEAQSGIELTDTSAPPETVSNDDRVDSTYAAEEPVSPIKDKLVLTREEIEQLILLIHESMLYSNEPFNSERNLSIRRTDLPPWEIERLDLEEDLELCPHKPLSVEYDHRLYEYNVPVQQIREFQAAFDSKGNLTRDNFDRFFLFRSFSYIFLRHIMSTVKTVNTHVDTDGNSLSDSGGDDGAAGAAASTNIKKELFVELVRLTQSEIAKYQEGYTDPIPTECSTNDDCATDEGCVTDDDCAVHENSTADDANNNKTEAKETIKKCTEKRKRPPNNEDSPYIPRPAKLFKPFAVNVESFESFYYDNYTLDPTEGRKGLRDICTTATDITSIIRRSIDSGTFSPADAEFLETSGVANSGYDSGIGMTPNTTIDEDSPLDDVFSRYNFDEATLILYKEILAKHCEEKKAKANYRAWEAKMTTITDALSEKDDFDVHKYEDEILNSFTEDKKEISFKNIVQKKSRREKSRLFLSMLQLASTDNIEIIDDTPGEICNETLKLKIVSKDRLSENLNDYQELSEESFNEMLTRPGCSRDVAHSTPTSSTNSNRMNNTNTFSKLAKRKKLSYN